MKFQVPINWFDALVVVVIVLGFYRGRKRGMSEECLTMLMWLTIMVVCAFVYEPLGTMIADASVFSKLSGFLMAYIGAGILISAFFLWLKKGLGGKLASADTFGNSEFVLGMMAGVVRFTCILIACLALLNARSYSNAEVQAEVKYQNDVYGSTFFPTLHDVQSQVFEKSFIGPYIRQYLGILLIKPTPPEKKELKQKEVAYP